MSQYWLKNRLLSHCRALETLNPGSQERRGCVPRSAVVARTVVFAGAQWLRERFLCDVGGVHEGPLIASSVSRPRCARLFRAAHEGTFFSVLGIRTAWYCDVSCMFEADDTCINLACSMPQDHQHVVGYVIGEECIKVVSFFFNAVCSCVGTVVLPSGT